MSRTTRSVLYETEHAGPAAHGGEAYVFPFPQDLADLQPYLVRRTFDFDPDLVKYSSALTQPRHLIGGMHVGQPLLQLEGHPQFTILARQPGISLHQWRVAQSKELAAQGITGSANACRTDIAFSTLMTQFDAHKGNPFVKIFEESYQLGSMGFAADGEPANIFIDTKNGTLGLVDQLSTHSASSSRNEQQALRNIDKLIARLTPRIQPAWNNELDTSLRSDWQRARSSIAGLLNDARDIVVAFHATDIARPASFAHVDSVKAISLDCPPQVLVAQLKHLAQAANIPSR